MIDWAMKKARELSAAQTEATDTQNAYRNGFFDDNCGLNALADYIREHEDAPEDPDLPLAREIAAEFAEKSGHPAIVAKHYRRGNADNFDDVQIALAAIKRVRAGA